jgi:uncharacterized RmlC-like cupin family protein
MPVELTDLQETESGSVQAGVAAPLGSAMGECVVIRPNETFRGRQHLAFIAGVSAQSAGARALSMHRLTMPPGSRAKAHYHASHETAIYMLSGEVETWYGARLERRIVSRAGEFIYIPAGVPHVPVNVSQTELASAIVVRTDPNEQESVVLTPELDRLVEPSGVPAAA